MARIRTVKPEFFRHEGLQDLEAAHPKKYPMLVFAGLWGHCDKSGRFEWRPRMLKLDILPFLNFDMNDALNLLAESGFVRRYTVDGNEYGVIDTFSEHQRIGGKEAQEPEKYPAPPETDREATGKQLGSTGEAVGIAGREGKGKEVKHSGVPPSGLNGSFSEFWSSYPRKKSKGAAEKAWLKIKPDEQLTARILAGVGRAKTSADWQREEGRFIPHPASWLNDRGWEDEDGDKAPRPDL